MKRWSNKFSFKKQLFTLIELVVVIVVLGILAAIVVPNVADMKQEAKTSAYATNIKSMQTAKDLYELDYSSLPTNEVPTLGKPQVIDASKVADKYVRDDLEGSELIYWVDVYGTVWGSTVDAPSNVAIANNTLTWEKEDENVQKYNLYIADKNKVTGDISKSKRYLKHIVTKTAQTENVVELEKLELTSEEQVLISAIDKFGLETAPVSLEYTSAENQFKEKVFVTKTVKKSVNEFEPLLNHEENGYTGTLRLSSEEIDEKLISGQFTEARKETRTVFQKASENKFISTFEEDGLTFTKVGESSSKVVSGEYIPAETKTVADTKTSSSNSFVDTLSYNQDGFVGTLTKSGSATPQYSTGTRDVYSSREVPVYSTRQVPVYSSREVAVYSTRQVPVYSSRTVYETRTRQQYSSCVRQVYSSQYRTMVCQPGYETITYQVPVTETYISGYKSESYVSGYTTETYVSGYTNETYQSGTRTETYVSGTESYQYVSGYTQKYSATVTKPEVDTRKYEYTQEYKGIVDIPEKDTRVYEYTAVYEGYIYK